MCVCNQHLIGKMGKKTTRICVYVQVNAAMKAGAVLICTAVFLENLICEKSTRSPSGLSFCLDAGPHTRFPLPVKKRKKEKVSRRSSVNVECV